MCFYMHLCTCKYTHFYKYLHPYFAVVQLLSLQPNGLWPTRLSCVSLTPRVCSNSCPLSWGCHPIISSSATLFSSCSEYFPASGSFPVSRFFASGDHSIGAPASASILPMNSQGWFPLGLTDLISLLSKELSRVFFNTTIWKHQFFGAQPCLWSNFHICMWLLEKPQLWLYGLSWQSDVSAF